MTQPSKLAAMVYLLSLAFPPRSRAQITTVGVSEHAQPSDLHFVISTKDDRTRFYLGEIIEVEQSYSSDTPDKYLLLSLPTKIKGHSAQFAIKPNWTVVDRSRDNGTRSAFLTLHANCGVGTGGGVGGGCSHCDNVLPLKPSPIHIMYNLTGQFQIMDPGHYSIQAEAANAALAPLDLENSAPIALFSNILEIEVADDPLWSRGKLQEAITRFEAAHSQYVTKGWETLPWDTMNAEQLGARTDLLWKMQSAAETMRVLDTEESLAEIIRRYDGATPERDYVNHVLLSGIIQSKHRSLAIKLLAARMLEPDFYVTKNFLDQLTAMAIENSFPDSFAQDDDGSRRRLYPAARKILQEYVLALGDRLEEKRPGALESSLQAFKAYAKEDFCVGEPLVPEATFNRIVRQLQAFDTDP